MLSSIPSSVYWSPYTHSTTAHQHPHIDLPVANIMTHILIYTQHSLHRYQFSIVCISFCNCNLLRPQCISAQRKSPPYFALIQYFRYDIQATPHRIRMLNLPTCIIYFILCSVKRTLLLTIGSNFTNLNFSGVCVTLRRVV